MKSEIIIVTPQIASEWLSANVSNRPLRRTVVDGLKAAFIRGEYVQTHQGIAFSLAGELLDGQHRLTAISELRDGAFPMLVTQGLADEAFQVMDIGVKRTAADSLRNDDKRVVEAARLIAFICTNKRASVTPTMLIPIIDSISRSHNSLIAFCPTVARTWSAAPVRLAAVLTMMTGGDADYVRLIYRSLVTSDFDSMPRVAQALYKSHVNGHVRASDHADMISRCMDVFSPRKANNGRIQIKDSGEATAKVRSVFGHLIERDEETLPQKKKATPSGVAKGGLRSDYSQVTSGR